jgi:GT2 family glycosyltransferase
VQHEKLAIIDNHDPAGFGANHNVAFDRCRTPYFCVINPDIKLVDNPFPALLVCLAQEGSALAAPLVFAPDGSIEDSVRRFPTLVSLLQKASGGNDGCYQVGLGQESFFPDWVGGMCMLFRSTSFGRMGGFDVGYFLYYEDVDICVRLWKSGLRVIACPSVYVVHDARRESRRNWRFLRWHLASMLRYFYKHLGRLPRSTRLPDV